MTVECNMITQDRKDHESRNNTINKDIGYIVCVKNQSIDRPLTTNDHAHRPPPKHQPTNNMERRGKGRNKL